MLELKNKYGKLEFYKENGNVAALIFRDRKIKLDGKSLFALGLRNSDGDLETLSSENFIFEVKNYEFPKEILVLSYTQCAAYPELHVDVTVYEHNGFFHFRPEIRNVSEEVLLEWIDVPQVVIPHGGKIFWPHMEGVMVDHPEERQGSPWSRYHILGFLERSEGIAYSEGGYYPGLCQMQFLSWEDNGEVLYFGAHDLKHGTKAVEYEPLEDGRCRLSLQTFCGAENPYVPEFDYVLGMTDGNWMDACSIYRDWVQNDPMLPPKGNLPEMVKESPVVMIYPVRGHGDDKGRMTEGNEYFPYTNALPAVEKYADLFESRILSLLMHWEGTAPWAPPYVWPPFGGAGMLREYSDAQHKQGHYLGVYCSGSAWTQMSCIVDYSREKECEEKDLRKHMIRGPKGEIEAVICCAPQAQRLGFDMCLTEDWPRNTLKEELKKMTECDLDYVQFFDQNLGGGYHTCYSREHKHPGVPGAWQTATMRSLLDEMVNGQTGDKMLLGCEGAAADAYLKNLPFNDLRACWNFGCGIPVPAYQFVFHEYCNNFMGNQCGITATLDSEASPEHFLYRTAYAFSSGDLLSIVLKEQGKIHWGWGALWEMNEPDQKQAITLIHNLNTFRKQYGEFLQFGRMEKPLLTIHGNEYTLHLTGRKERLKSWFHSSWTSPDGKRAEIITNFLPVKQTVRCVSPDGYRLIADSQEFPEKELLLEPLSAVCVQLKKRQPLSVLAQ